VDVERPRVPLGGDPEVVVRVVGVVLEAYAARSVECPVVNAAVLERLPGEFGGFFAVRGFFVAVAIFVPPVS
jgi:hypothetical protein